MSSIKTINTVIGIIKQGNKFLIAQRPEGKPHSGYWEFPGGKVEPNESIEAALKRELKEELGIEVLSATSWFKHQYQYPDKIVFLEVWQVSAFTGTPCGIEHQLLKWATYDEMLQLPLLEGNIPIIHKIGTAPNI